MLVAWGRFVATRLGLRPPDLSRPPALCEYRDHQRGKLIRLPPRMLEAIAEVESGRPEAATGRLQPWPWTINAEGVGAFFASKEEAIAAVKALAGARRPVDRRGLHAGQPDVSPDRVRLAGGGVRPACQCAVRGAFPECAACRRSELVRRDRRLSFADPGDRRRLSAARAGALAGCVGELGSWPRGRVSRLCPGVQKLYNDFAPSSRCTAHLRRAQARGLRARGVYPCAADAAGRSRHAGASSTTPSADQCQWRRCCTVPSGSANA